MSSIPSVIGRPGIILGVGLCAALLASGCRYDSIESMRLDSGDAIANNKAVHTIDPWPPGAFRRHHRTNGKRMADAYEAYQAKPPAPTAAGNTPPTSAPDANPSGE